MMDDGGRRRGQHTERQRREHLVIPRTPTANNVDAVLSSADSDSAFFRSAANGDGGGGEPWSGVGSGATPLSPLRSTEKAKSKSSKRAEWMQRQLKQRAGTLEKLEALLNASAAGDDDDEQGDLDSIAHIDKDLIPKISRLRGDREELIRMCSDAVQELNRKEEQNRALEEANAAQGRMIEDLQRQMHELREQMQRLATAATAQPPAAPRQQQQQQQPSRPSKASDGGGGGGTRAASGRRRKARGGGRERAGDRSLDDSDEDEEERGGSGFSSDEGDDDHVHSSNGRRRGGGGRHRHHHHRRRRRYSDDDNSESEGSYSDDEANSNSSEDGDGDDASGRRRDRRKHTRTGSTAHRDVQQQQQQHSGRDREGKERRRRRGESEEERTAAAAAGGGRQRTRGHPGGQGAGGLEHTVSHLSSRCSDLELGKKLLCVKLASTTERLNNMHLQNKALLNAMYACSVHNAEVKTILARIEHK